MTEQDANWLVQRVRDLVGCNSEQAERLRRLIAPLAVQAVDVAIDRYVLSEETLRLPRFAALLEELAPRHSTQLAAARQERQQHVCEEAEMERRFAQLTPAQLQQETHAVFESLPPETRAYIKPSNPTQSTLLRALVYNHLKQRQSS